VEELLAPVGGGGGLVALPFPLPRRLEPKGGTVGSMWYSCNLTGHVTRKSRDSVRGVSESANCTWRENRGEEAWTKGPGIGPILVQHDTRSDKRAGWKWVKTWGGTLMWEALEIGGDAVCAGCRIRGIRLWYLQRTYDTNRAGLRLQTRHG